METIDYASQAQQIGDLLDDRGVQLTRSDRAALLMDLRNSLTQGECRRREFNLGGWILILEGADEYALLLENMPETE